MFVELCVCVEVCAWEGILLNEVGTKHEMTVVLLAVDLEPSAAQPPLVAVGSGPRP